SVSVHARKYISPSSEADVHCGGEETAGRGDEAVVGPDVGRAQDNTGEAERVVQKRSQFVCGRKGRGVGGLRSLAVVGPAQVDRGRRSERNIRVPAQDFELRWFVGASFGPSSACEEFVPVMDAEPPVLGTDTGVGVGHRSPLGRQGNGCGWGLSSSGVRSRSLCSRTRGTVRTWGRPVKLG